MVVLGTDAHKRSHTIVAVDPAGAEIGSVTVPATTEGHLKALRWASRWNERRWAIEDCRHLSRRLETDLLAAGESVVRVPPKMMAGQRRSARTRGKSDPIDARSVARAALSEPDLPAARLDDISRELRLLVDYREQIIGERTALVNNLRWRLHELDPSFDPPARSLNRYKTLQKVREFLARFDGIVPELAVRETDRIEAITREANQLETEIRLRVAQVSPLLLTLDGCGALTAAKLIGETADITRFKSRDAYASWNGTAPIPVWSANNERVRLNRGGNRQVNAALHRIAITQLRSNPDAKAFVQRRLDASDTKKSAIRALKRRLSDVVYRTMLTDANNRTATATDKAA